MMNGKKTKTKAKQRNLPLNNRTGRGEKKKRKMIEKSIEKIETSIEKRMGIR